MTGYRLSGKQRPFLNGLADQDSDEEMIFEFVV